MIPNLGQQLSGPLTDILLLGRNTQVSLEQRSPTFSAPGTGFVEDSFSTDGVGGGRGAGGMAQAVMRGMGSDGKRQMNFACSPPAVQPGS